jgi:hypothetical protein
MSLIDKRATPHIALFLLFLNVRIIIIVRIIFYENEYRDSKFEKQNIH